MKRWLVVCLFVFGIALFFNLLVSAEHIVSLAGGENSTNVDEDGSYFCNISVEILDDGQDANVTEVNVTLPTNFTLAAETNGTDFVGEFFVDGNVLSWQNFTDYAVNGTATQYFWFNTTASVPGSYNITVTTANATDVVSTNISVVVNDTTVPEMVVFGSSADADGANLTRDYIVYNVSVVDNGDLDVVVVYLYNSTQDQINSSISSTSPLEGNFTGLSDGVYYMNASGNDTYSNINYTADTRMVTVDTTYPLISFGDGTESDYANVSQSNVYVNVSVTETNELNITFTLYNSTSEENSTTFGDGTRTINWTGLGDGTYTYNVTVYDYVGYYNYTETYTITLDNVGPSVEFVSPTASTGTNLSQTYVLYNISLNDATVVDSVVVYLYNETLDLINSTGSATNPTEGNFTELGEGTYYLNASGNDTLGNNNVSTTLMYILDTTEPTVVLNTPENYTSTTATSMNFTFNLTETNSIANCSLILNGAVSQSSSSIGNNGTYGIYKTSLGAGTYNWSINCTDTAGNVGNGETWVLTVTTATEEEEGTPVSSGGGGGWSSYYPILRPGDKVKQGYTAKISKGWQVEFNVNNEKHHVKLLELVGEKATIEISSTPLQVILGVGESEKVDVTGNGYYDLIVKVNSIKGSFLEFTMTAINEKVPEAPRAETPPSASDEAATEEVLQQAPPENSAGESSNGHAAVYVVVSILVIVVIAVGAYLYWYNRKLKKHTK